MLDAGSTDARRGFQKEFEAIIAAVIGGCLLTGGYGSAIGAFFGAHHLRHGLDRADLHRASTATGSRSSSARMLLLAVLFNNFIRQQGHGGALSMAATSPTTAAAVIEVRDIVKHFGSVIALSRRLDDGARRRGALPARRQRRRQVDADQDACRACYRPTAGEYLVEGQPVDLRQRRATRSMPASRRSSRTSP